MKVPVQLTKDGVVLLIQAQPGAAQSKWCGLHGEALKLRVAARAVEGAANAEICRFVAEYFQVPKSAVTLISGTSSRIKAVKVTGDAERLAAQSRQLYVSADRDT